MAIAPIITPVFRLAFPTLFTPKAPKNNPEKKQYSIQMIFTDQRPFFSDANGNLVQPRFLNDEAWAKWLADYEKDPTHCVRVRRHLAQACVDKWGDDKAKWPMPFSALDLAAHVSMDGKNWPIRDGNLVAWDGFKGGLFARAATGEDHQPGVVNASNTVITDPKQVMGGMLARAKINAYAWKHPQGGCGVSIGLHHVQIVSDDGTRYGASSGPVEEAFGAWDDSQGTFASSAGEHGQAASVSADDF